MPFFVDAYEILNMIYEEAGTINVTNSPHINLKEYLHNAPAMKIHSAHFFFSSNMGKARINNRYIIIDQL